MLRVISLTLGWAFSLTTMPALADASATLLAAGDIADCGAGATQTAKLLATLPGTILALGDLAYPKGSKENFQRCFVPTWGQFRDRMLAVPGNHDYMTAGGQPYFAELRNAAGPIAQGYYSQDIAGWHLIALNTELSPSRQATQLQWLKADLAATKARCRLAFFHQPRFSSGESNGNDDLDPLWRALAEGGVSITLAGHDHHYERLAPLNATGQPDDKTGIRSFTVGTGGATLDKQPWWTIKASEKLIAGTWGVLKLDLQPDAYRWTFLSTEGKALDQGSGTCRVPKAGQ